MRFLAKFLKDDKAATAVEYSVMLALILMVMLASIGLVGTQSGTMWGNIATSIEAKGK